MKICAAVKDFDPTEFVDRKEVRRNDPFIIYGMAAGIEAIADAGLEAHPADPHRYGIAVGSGIGGIGTAVSRSLSVGISPLSSNPFQVFSAIQRRVTHRCIAEKLDDDFCAIQRRVVINCIAQKPGRAADSLGICT